MMDERKEEMAAMYALGIMEAHEAHGFEEDLKTDPALKALVDGFMRDAASLAHVAPFQEAPDELRERILQSIHHIELEQSPGEYNPGEPSEVVKTNVVPFKRPVAWLPWAMAAGFAVMAGLLFTERSKMKSEIAELRTNNDVCQMQVSMLGSMNGSPQKSVAVVIWDASTQTGVLKGENMPRPAANEDYQLWVVDDKYPQPVNAGVFTVDEKGVVRAIFKPALKTKSTKFAVSVEPKGGVQQHDKGPIVMMSKEL